MDNEEQKTSWYERTVGNITDIVKPYLHQKCKNFIDKSIEKYAKDNPRLAKMIEFEVKRRGDGAGLTQDVGEPALWICVKTAAAIATIILTESLKEGKFKMVGRVSALGVVLSNGVEAFRLVPRYVAGLQGSLQMALDRERAVKETGIDPFDQGGNGGSRLIHKPIDELAKPPNWEDYITEDKMKKFVSDELKKLEIQPKTHVEYAEHGEVEAQR